VDCATRSNYIDNEKGYDMFRGLSDYIKSIFTNPSAEALALRELEAAKRSVLEMQTAFDYSKRMVEYHNDRIKRLTAMLNESR